MTHMFKKQSSSSMLTHQTTTTSGALAMHRDSRVISKVQPKIRIIHIFAPEIIKTDVANFRELVQRLTGKPDAGGSKGKDHKGKGKKVKPEAARLGCNNNNSNNNNNISTKLDIMVGSGSSSSPSSSSDQQNHHDHQEAWRLNGGDHIQNNHNNNNNNSSGGYLTGFTDLDYSFDFNNLFHLGAADGSSHLNSIAENTQISYRG